MYQIPNNLEKLVLTGQATFKTKQFGIAEQFVLPVPTDRFIVIYGFRFIPFNPDQWTGYPTQNPQNFLQMVNFLTGSNFFTYTFRPTLNWVYNDVITNYVTTGTTSQFEQSCYILANSDVGIYISRAIAPGQAGQGLTFGGLPLQFQNTWNDALGYGGNVTINRADNYHGFIAPPAAYIYNPLEVYQPNGVFAGTPGSVFDQLFTIPILGGAIDTALYDYGANQNAYNALHFLQIDYVEIMATKPENLQL